jgi:hypothetical protein
MVNYQKYVDIISDIIFDNIEIDKNEKIVNIGKDVYKFDKDKSLHILSEMLFEQLGNEYLNDIYKIENLWRSYLSD